MSAAKATRTRSSPANTTTLEPSLESISTRAAKGLATTGTTRTAGPRGSIRCIRFILVAGSGTTTDILIEIRRRKPMGIMTTTAIVTTRMWRIAGVSSKKSTMTTKRKKGRSQEVEPGAGPGSSCRG
ncbi:hypothetical protein MAPG_05999 [Magnaporthiopsis poae ATCC 64411]|uniref:Uncharacterized protein n=1 Tax=Magnaporthiopsis poae (strain ATCC 64411 / 73-15) TaxID=644358 RepID=A0A0C4E0W1_MAGP6|nr:hypothetical protein MAPG_05999 [Magnaporthiopsis poae ATCC 64411]